MSTRPVTIAGGGLAGLALGLGLRQRGVPVTIWEAGHYPRQKVCGEFISGRGLDTLSALGLRTGLMEAGACWAYDAAFYMDGRSPVRFVLPRPALCISRSVLDEFLARTFQAAGGELRERRHWSGSFAAEGVVRATGHRVVAAVNHWRWFGLKVHARRMALQAGLEMHLREDGYVGLCQLADRVNVCGLFRMAQPRPNLRRAWRDLLRGPAASSLAGRMEPVQWDEESFRAVAGLDLRPRRANRSPECAIGDAQTMIAPATGNGMSMALEAAALALDPLTRYSRGEIDWASARQDVADACNGRFQPRLRFARHLQAMLFHSRQRALLWWVAFTFPSAVRFLFRHTR